MYVGIGLHLVIFGDEGSPNMGLLVRRTRVGTVYNYVYEFTQRGYY